MPWNRFPWHQYFKFQDGGEVKGGTLLQEVLIRGKGAC